MLRGTWQTQSRSAHDASEASQLQEIPPETITVAIFCALPHEVVAVKCSLDEEFSCRPKKVDPKNYMYSFGRIGSLRIVIAQFHSVGTVSAAHGATAVSHQFPNVMFALLVGTGTGIPDPPSTTSVSAILSSVFLKITTLASCSMTSASMKTVDLF